MNNLQPINQSPAAKSRSDSQPSLDTAHSVAMGFESVLRDVRRSGNGQEIATATGKKMPPGADLQKYALGPRVKIITSSDPAPDEQSLIAFARTEGIDEALLNLIMGKTNAPTKPATDDSSVPDAATPTGTVDPALAIPFGGLIQTPVVLSSLVLAAEPATPAAGPSAASRPWLSFGAKTGTGAPGLRLPTDAAAGGNTAPAPTATAGASAPGVPELAQSAGGTVEPRAEIPVSGSAVRPAPTSPFASVGPGLNNAGARNLTASETPLGPGKPVDAPGATAKSIEVASAPVGTAGDAPADVSNPFPRNAQTVGADTAKTPAPANQAVPDQTNQDGAAIDGKVSPSQTEPAEHGAAQVPQAPQKEALNEHIAALIKPEGEKPGKSRSDASQTVALREIDAPAAAETPQSGARDSVSQVSAAASGDHPQSRGGAAQDLDLGTSAPAREESMQDAHFRRSEQYQQLSDRVSEAIGQRLSAQIAKGEWQVSLQLNPRHLGKIDVRLGMRGGGTIDAEFNTDQQHTRDLLLNGLPRLKEVMAASGIDMANMEVKHEGASAQGGNPHARQSLRATPPGPFPGTQTPAAQAASHTARIGADGLDVMV
ncbi:MAG: flagellar hook-length control protein FliK [Proteobacteria bacterium]|nr:flagellar hook-length control protein FliK [Pseudomonadota bacterium]